jgi:hypothetical protein
MMYQFKTLFAGLVLAVAAATATLALPHVYKSIVSDFAAGGQCEPEETPSPETETPEPDGGSDDAGQGSDCEEPGDGDGGSDPEKGEGPGADENDEGSSEADNHGQVVKIVAHCDVKGRAHGALVSSIARDKDATVEEAEKACEEAMAAVESGDAVTKGKPEKNKPEKSRPDHAAKSHGKPEHVKDNGKAKDAPNDKQAEDTDGADNDSSSHGQGGGKTKDK